MSSPTLDKILIALKSTVDGKVNFHYWQDIGSSQKYTWQECQILQLKKFWYSQSYPQQECQLPLPKQLIYLQNIQLTGMSTLFVDRIVVALKSMVEKSVSFICWMAFRSSGSYIPKEYRLPLLVELWQLWRLRLKGMSTSTVNRIFLGLKNMVNGKVNSHCWRDFGCSKRFGRQECQLPLLIRFW